MSPSKVTPRGRHGIRSQALDDRLAEAHTALGWIKFFYDWDWEGSGSEHRRALEVNPNFWVAWVQLGKSYERMGRYDEALEAFEKATASGGTSEALSLAGYTYAVSGRRGVRELTATGKHSYVPPYNVALVHYGLGDTEDALRWLERAYEERDAHLVLLGVEPRWDSLRDNPRFKNLLERTNLPR